MISLSRLSLATSALNRDSSMASGVTTFVPAPLSFPSDEALI